MNNLPWSVLVSHIWRVLLLPSVLNTSQVLRRFNFSILKILFSAIFHSWICSHQCLQENILEICKYALLPLCFVTDETPPTSSSLFCNSGHFTKFVRWSCGAIEGVTYLCWNSIFFRDFYKYLTFSLHFLFFSVEKWLCFSNCKYKVFQLYRSGLFMSFYITATVTEIGTGNAPVLWAIWGYMQLPERRLLS